MMDNGNLAFAGVPEVQKGGEGGQAASDTSVKVRKDFPETFIWAEDTTEYVRKKNIKIVLFIIVNLLLLI